MATISASLKTTVDAKLDALVTDVSSPQSTYKTANGKHWQGIRCISTIPADGGTLATDLTVKPTDQSEDWTNINGAGQGVSVDATLPVCLQVDTYNGPQGHGYVVSGLVVENTRTFSREVNIGPETYREHDWIDITPEE